MYAFYILKNLCCSDGDFYVLTVSTFLAKDVTSAKMYAGPSSWCFWGYLTSSLAQVPVLCLWFSTDVVSCYHSGRNINVESNGLCMQSVNRGTKSRNRTKLDGYSFSLCTKIIETLRKSNVNFHIQTLHVLGHNTRWDSLGHAFPIFNGFLVSFDFMNSFLHVTSLVCFYCNNSSLLFVKMTIYYICISN